MYLFRMQVLDGKEQFGIRHYLHPKLPSKAMRASSWENVIASWQKHAQQALPHCAYGLTAIISSAMRMTVKRSFPTCRRAKGSVDDGSLSHAPVTCSYQPVTVRI